MASAGAVAWGGELMTARITKTRAREIAKQAEGYDEEGLRDFVDHQTGGELDCVQLDMLTDWVAQSLWGERQ